jgi:hypothetical protein
MQQHVRITNKCSQGTEVDAYNDQVNKIKLNPRHQGDTGRVTMVIKGEGRGVVSQRKIIVR